MPREMMPNACDCSSALTERVSAALKSATPLRIVGGNTKAFYGRMIDAEPLQVNQHCGVVSYEPSELALTARGGTPLAEVQQLLAENRQMLAFEPPCFGGAATIGGMVAAGLSGPRRPYVGAVRDFVLGVRVLTGKGDILKFGGAVMKNVAGYDVSRLMVGAMGTLGIILEATFKVLPQPETEQLRCFDTNAERALTLMSRWAGRPLPISAMAHEGTQLRVRLSGSENSVTSAARHLGGETDAVPLWFDQLREQQLPFFAGEVPLWRISLPAATVETAVAIDTRVPQLFDWGGAQRWLRSAANAALIHQAARNQGGHAVCFRQPNLAVRRSDEFMTVLAPQLLAIHQRLKRAFDPHQILNPGRLYADL